MENPFNQKAFRNLSYALLALLVAFVAAKIVGEVKGVQYIGAGAPMSNTITVNGTGDVVAAPDIATFSFSVQKEGVSVPEAQQKSTDGVNAILAYLKKAGVEDKDIKTLSYNIYPRYEYQGANYYNGGKQILAAYVVSQMIEVKVRKLDQAGALLTGIGEYGATDVSGLQFSFDKQTEVERQARDKAIADAREQANVLARSLGVSIVRIVSFSEYSNGRVTPLYYAKDMMMSQGTGASAPQIPTGENKVTSNVSITYEIK